MVVGNLSDNGSARGTGVDEVRIFAVVKLLQKDSGVRFAELHALLVKFDNVVENLFMGFDERFGVVAEFGERRGSEPVRGIKWGARRFLSVRGLRRYPRNPSNFRGFCLVTVSIAPMLRPTPSRLPEWFCEMRWLIFRIQKDARSNALPSL